jgi:hypothetical protein
MNCQLTSILVAARADDLARAASSPRADRPAAGARTRETARHASSHHLPGRWRYVPWRTSESRGVS